MADIVYLNTSPKGAQVLNAVDQIQQGFATLRRLDGLRLESIGAGQAIMQQNFGVQDAAQAQALSDRWGALLALLYGDIPAWMTTAAQARAAVRDFIDALTLAP